MRKSTKADLLSCLFPDDETLQLLPDVDAEILDGPAIVQMLLPKGCKDINQYAKEIFLPFLTAHLNKCQRLDIVWDVYRPDSLKRETQDSRGKGIRRKVTDQTPVPINWQGFLCVDDNKAELFNYLSTYVIGSLK